MSFPAKDNLCTRYAGTLDGLDLGKIVDEAKDVMGLGGSTKAFSTDVLRVEVRGPSQPHLTMVDLPGLFLAGNKDQSDEDAALVEALVLSYMKNPRTIILAVVSAKSDFALQQITRHAREQDPNGTRTLGLITKPDTLDEGSDSERFYIELAQNKDTLKPTQLGVAALRVRLSLVLRDQILNQLPSVLDDVTEGMNECKSTLAKLGTARATVAEQRRYLLKIGTAFSDLTRAAIDGIYTDTFFSGPKDRRLRAVVQNTLANFAAEMHQKGHARTIVDTVSDEQLWASSGKKRGKNDKPAVITRDSYIEEVRKLLLDSRGRELPGTYNPLIVAELFRNQCKPWKGMVEDLLDRVFASAVATTESILRHVADAATAEAVLAQVVSPALENIKSELNAKAAEILEPHISGHPITYNHYLTENVQKAQAERQRKRVERTMKEILEVGDLRSWRPEYHSIDMSVLLNALSEEMEPDMDTYSCSMATDMMEAYYKV
ncbi:uncharacterized protein THITE_54974 [Thermothielavioides terrestris NRRL 8126]|uniref:Dynamin GTPase domain-containing protein n=1 Tax=Thermothielavioides terrestris (strain ATCC 38088 / NRRL 8126) TaxID=578455 RepID=G2R0M8_THETT|nr:uncharacterized protein THITE_54974 [Thermothielavioides terrestris NRRL 8126]AEO66496.1 hypothetical protein THITE_54974 [Thermothielavioides terrestris NRRL 8126]